MTGARRRQGQVSAHFLCLLSILALLAFALFPVAAGADSSGVQYSDAPPTATGKEPPSEAPAKSSKSHNGGSNPSNTSHSQEAHSSNGETSPGSTTPKSDSVSSSTANSGRSGTDKQGTRGQGSHAQPQSGQQQGQSVATESPASNSDSGSSPLIPVLIAIAVLAAISIGIVMLRRRRGGSVKTVSPKAS